jgi:hypothetical protein
MIFRFERVMFMKRTILAVTLLAGGTLFQDKGWAVVNQEIIIKPVEDQEKALLEQRAKAQLAEIEAKKDTSQASLVERARLAYWIGQYAAKDEDKLKSYEYGMTLMEPLTVSGEDPAPALLWAANAGGFASIKRNLGALKLLEKIEQKLLLVAARFPAFESGAADRALASIYWSAPRFVSVGSRKKAEKHAHLAFEKDPHHPGNLLLMAKVFQENGDEGRAQMLFKQSLNLSMPDRYPLDYAVWRTEALEGLGTPQGLKL